MVKHAMLGGSLPSALKQLKKAAKNVKEQLSVYRSTVREIDEVLKDVKETFNEDI